MMIRKEKEGIEWLEFELLAQFPKLQAAIFSRKGGVSQGPFDSLNVSAEHGDQLDAVHENRKRVHKILKEKTIIFSQQVHGKEVIEVTNKNLHRKLICDGLMTQKFGLALMTMHADCQAAIFYDPENHALATAHCGWRGSQQNIYRNVVLGMKTYFGTKPSNLHVCVGPSLGPFKGEFVNYKTELPEKFWDFQVSPNYFDFWEISRHQLKESGILSHHIQVAGICTYLEPQDFFSYRRDKLTGRNGTAAFLSE